MYLLGHRHRASLRVRLRLGRHCIRHPAWAVIQHHTPGYTPVPWTWHPNRDCPFRASNNRPETNPPPIALPWPDTQCNHNRGGTGEDTQCNHNRGGALETTHRAPPPGTHGSLARPTLPYTYIYIYTEGTHRHGADHSRLGCCRLGYNTDNTPKLCIGLD
jgi:hypothetical protein